MRPFLGRIFLIDYWAGFRHMEITTTEKGNRKMEKTLSQKQADWFARYQIARALLEKKGR